MMLQEKTKQNHPKWPYIPDHPSRTLIIGGSGLGEKDALINHQPDLGKIYIYGKDAREAKLNF